MVMLLNEGSLVKFKRKDLPDEAQGNVATGKGEKFAKQIHLENSDVNFVRKKDSLAPFSGKTHPEVDKLLKRPGYTNNVSVLIDLVGQEFQFKAPLVTQPRATDIDVAHSVLDRMSGDAKAGGQFVPQTARVDEIGFLIREQAKERALAELEQKEVLMLREGLSPDEIATLTGQTRERLLRKYEMASPMETLVENIKTMRRREIMGVVGTAGVSTGIGVNSITDGPRTYPALSVPNEFVRLGAGGGQADVMGRTPATGSPSAGFRSNRTPTTTSGMGAGLTDLGQRSLPSVSSGPYYGPSSNAPPTSESERERMIGNFEREQRYVRRLDPLQRGMRLGGLFGDFRNVGGLPPHPRELARRAARESVVAAETRGATRVPRPS